MTASAIPPALSLLEKDPSHAADAALVEALPTLEAHARDRAWAALRARKHAPSLTALVGGFAKLDGALKAMMAAYIHDLFDAVELALTSHEVEHRLGAIALIDRANCVNLAYLLANAVRTHCATTRDAAGDAIQNLAAKMLAQSENDDTDHEAASRRAMLVEALRETVMHWESHFHPRVLEAGLWFMDQLEPTFVQKLEDPHTRVAHMINGLIDATSDPRMADCVVRSLACPSLRASALSAISRAQDVSFTRAIVAKAPLFDREDIGREAKRIKDAQWLHKKLDDLLDAGEGQEAQAVRWLVATGGAMDLKFERMREVIDVGGDPWTRAAVACLMNDSDPAALRILEWIAARRHGDELGRWAEAALSGRTTKTKPAASTESPEAELHIAAPSATRPPEARGSAQAPELHIVRHDALAPSIGFAKPQPAPAELPGAPRFDECWSGFSALTDQHRADFVKKFAPLALRFLPALRRKLALGEADERWRALSIIRLLNSADACREQVYRACHDQDARTRSLAVSMLSEWPGPTAERILRVAVEDRDQRVQANAVEALDRMNSPARAPMTERKLRSPDARVRANAIRSLLRMEVRDAGEALLEMLASPLESHRTSALWVVENLKLRSILERVNAISERDPEERVRRRARKLLVALCVRGASKHISPAGRETQGS